MTSPHYRLPVGVGCSSKNGIVTVKGIKGKVSFKCKNRILRKGNLVNFAPFLSPYYGSIFTQAVLGVVLGYTVELRLKGVGYRVKEEEGNLVFSLGYSHPVVLKIPENIYVELGKKTFFLRSANYGLLRNFASTIRKYRIPDFYKGCGVLYEGEIVKCKEGKKT
uniref:ribosomal protein L6 n=1 Tax=Scytothamnus australis TaxID=66621 RepID=UPI002E7A6D9F|nr:ribosomal protein L6 [Scytothamnus australis]WBP70289.1 ribosomal protein L6 [Scytothamnus australis]